MTTNAPILFIGGLGGSGTRAVAGAVAELGYYPGGCLNESNDNLIFTELFKRPDWLRADPPAGRIRSRLQLYESVMTGGVRLRHLLRAPALHRFRRDQGGGLADAPDSIGWMTKEPNCHIFLEAILETWAQAAFVYVSRHPLDMAFSDNKGQLGNWSWLFDLDPTEWPTREAAQLEYWIRTQKRLDTLIAHYPGRILPLRFDDFAERPVEQLTALVDALGLPVPVERIVPACADVIRPEGIGRWRSRDLSAFSPEQIGFCRDAGWDV
ncbi:sulfotransferase [Thalassobaculum sp.]|uniref:sulfotransferase family protein n=1 Tax=Thalassobaculum sp. TaxID=2022740 RepID=UPI0032ECAE3A